jgi:hypothetical protein
LIRIEVVDRAVTEFTITVRPQEGEGQVASMSLAFIHAGPIGSRTTTGICREPARFW